MVCILRETEGEPTDRMTWARRSLGQGNLLPDDPEVPAEVIWRRIEDWTAHRWGERAVEWIVEGPGHWQPRLTPFTVDAIEKWTPDGWAPDTPPAAPLGLFLDAGTWRIAGTAGEDGPPPPAVAEAFQRLAEYMHGIAKTWNNEAAQYGGDGTQLVAGWAAKGLHLSGAADLLRPYRGIGR